MFNDIKLSVKAAFPTFACRTSGLYYTHITIVNDASRVMLQIVASLMIVIDDTC
jgi:hypothetical protein